MNDPREVSTPPGRELFAEQLLGREVRDPGNDVLGRIVDICVGDEGGDLVVRHYLVGPARSSSRLSVSNLAFQMLSLLGLPFGARSYAVPWHDMDLSDPLRPRVRRPKGALPLANPGH
jgi:hypothetical protein